MAGKDLRLTAIFAVRDQLSPVIQKLAKSWTGLRNTLNSDNFKKLNGQFRQFRRSLTNVTDQVTEAGKKLALPITAAAAAVGFSLSTMMSKFLSVGDSIDKASVRVGVSAERLQKLRYAANLSGASTDILDKSLAKLNENIAKASAGKNEDLASLFRKLGISLKDANGKLRTAADVMPAFANAIQRNTDAGLRARMMIAAFGEEGLRLVPMLEGGADGLKAMEERADKLGIAMSGADVKAAADLGDRFSELGMVFDAFGNTLSAKLAPVLSPIINNLTEFIAKNKEAFSNRISQAVATFADKLQKIDFQRLADTCSAAFDAIGSFFDSIGGFETVLKVIAGLFAGKLVIAIANFIGSVMTLASSFWSLLLILKTVGIAFLASPIGMVIAGIAAGAALIISNWDTVGPYFKSLWESIYSTLGPVIENIKKYFTDLADGVITIFKGLFNLDLKQITDGFCKTFGASFNLLPDSVKKIGPKMLENAGNILTNIGNSFTNFFSNLDLMSMLPDSFKKGMNFIAEKLGWTDNKTAAPIAGQPALAVAGVPNSGIYASAPIAAAPQSMQGTMKIEVTATGGAQATVSEATSSDNLKISGDVGHSGRGIGGD